MIKPKVSIVTIVFNGRDFIEKTLISCTQQCNIETEYIVVDGQSSDGTLELIEKYRSKIDILISEKDEGLYDAMNKGLKRASGDFIIFMNGGDEFACNNTLGRIFEGNDYMYHHVGLIYGDSYVIKSNQSFYKKAFKDNYIWYGMFTNHQAMIYNLHTIRKVNLTYNNDYKVSADYQFTAEFLKVSPENIYLDIPFCKFYLDGISSTSKDLGLNEANKIRQEILKLSGFQITLIHFFIKFSHYFASLVYPLYKYLRFK